MLAGSTRSGLTESTHRTSAIALDRRGRLLLTWGDPDIPVFYRSAVKPFQATVSLEAGAALAPEEVAIICASHCGAPTHIAYVRSILRSAGLDERALLTPPAWPLGPSSAARRRNSGEQNPRRIYHNCSGKHSGWLAGSVAAGWQTQSYLNPSHPIQQAVLDAVHDATGADPTPTGIDGCGAPTLRGTVRGLARAFVTLTTDDRYRRVAEAMSRFPALAGGNERAANKVAAWWGGPIKGGAQGLLAAGRDGVAIAVKAADGAHWVATVAMMEAMRRLGMLSSAALAALEDVAAPPVWGGGNRVGRVEINE